MSSFVKQKRLWLLILYPVSLILLYIAKNNHNFSEHVFAQGVYKFSSQGISFVTGIFPFSLIEIIIILGVFAVLALCVYFPVKLIKNKENRLKIIKRAGMNILCFGGVILFGFTVLCGMNYYRYPFSYHSGLNIQPSSKEDLYNLCIYLADEANRFRSEISKENDDGVMMLSEDFWENGRIADESFDLIAKKYPVLGGNYPSPKPVMFSDFMSRTQITGVFSNFTMEANINTSATEYTIPATMCHELAHLRGFMREDEANYIAYLVCRQSNNAEFKYSGTMLGLVYAGNQLYKVDYNLYKELSEKYSDAVRRDMHADYIYWKQFEKTAISEVSSKINDTYLKINNQQDGVKSYGRMVDYLIAEYKQNH